MINKLPQHETAGRASQRRRAHLHQMQARYEYAYEYARTIAVVRKLPWREIPGLRYWLLGGLHLAQLIPSLPSLLMTVLRHMLGAAAGAISRLCFLSAQSAAESGTGEHFSAGSAVRPAARWSASTRWCCVR